MKFADVPKFTRAPFYMVHYPLADVPHMMSRWKPVLNPPFQRDHVWSPAQRVKFIEYWLSGGRSGIDLYLNQPGWSAGRRGNLVVVDGKQRLTSALKFLNDEFPVYGAFYSEYDRIPTDVHFRVHVNELEYEHEVIRWYLEMNSGGTIHTEQELERVRAIYENLLLQSS